jgi:hypothetical protein
MRTLRYILLGLLLAAALVGCAGAGAGTGAPAAKAVESYLSAMVAQDGTKLSNATCKAFEDKATLDMDAFVGVKAELQNMTCQENGKNGDQTQVTCTGKIVATYNNEQQQIDLAGRTYQVTQEGGEWRVCGYK